jgi:hypothetical protein
MRWFQGRTAVNVRERGGLRPISPSCRTCCAEKTKATTGQRAAGVTSRLWEIGDIVGVLEAWENTA